MSSANLNSYMKEYLKRQPRTLSMSQIEELIEYDAWLESRSPTLRAAVQSEQNFSKSPECPYCKRFYSVLLTKIDCYCGAKGELGEWHNVEFGWKWFLANTKNSNRSDGG